MYYPDELIEEIRTQNNILNVISDYVHLVKKGNSHFGLCPFHNEKSPSFSVSEDKQMYYCFGCGAGGNVFTFVMEYENFNFVEAVKYLADRVNIQLPEAEVSEEMKKAMSHKQRLLDANKEAARYYYYAMTKDTRQKAAKYLVDRGIDEEIKKKFGLGYAQLNRDDLYRYLYNKGFDSEILVEAGLAMRDKNRPDQYYDRFFDRLMFPIFDVHGRVIAFGGRILGDGQPKYLNSPETTLFDKSRNLYGLNIARTARKKQLILVEGYMDVIALHQAGFVNAIASLGTAFTTGHASLIRRYVEEVVISYDTDGAGINAALRAIPILKKAGLSVRVLQVAGAKDPDEYIQKFGPEGFQILIDEAMPSFMFEVVQLEKNHNLTDPASRTQFDEALARKLLTLDNMLERDNYMKALCDRYDIKPSIMEATLASLGKNIGLAAPKENLEPEVVKQRDSKDVIMRAQKNLLTFMTSHERVFKVVKDYLAPKEFPDDVYRKVAEWVYDSYENRGGLEPSKIIMQFNEVEAQNQVANIFNNNMPIEHSGQFEKIIKENIQIIKKRYIEALSRNVRDPVQLQEMILMKRQLDHMQINLEQ